MSNPVVEEIVNKLVDDAIHQAVKDIKKKKQREKVNCDVCNKSVCKNNLPRHKRTKKCTRFLTEIKQDKSTQTD